MSFAHPWILVLLIVPILWVLDMRRRRAAMQAAASFAAVEGLPAFPSVRSRAREMLPYVRAVVLALLLVALARPLFGESEEIVVSEGIDIVLALDISGSMRAEDFQPDNRLKVAKEVAYRFIEGRRGDRIGLVVFAANAYTQCPLTSDYPVLLSMLEKVDFGDIRDGTAIGMGIATAANRLREAGSQSRVVILLTDGRNNAGTIDPVTAAELAKAVGVRVHTIAAGGTEDAPFPIDDPILGRRYVRMPVSIDEETLKKVADLTGGRYFRATDAGALVAIYQTIDQMEKTKIETRTFVDYSEFGGTLLLPALLLLLLEVILGHGPLRKLP